MNIFAQIVLVLVAIAVLWIWGAATFDGDTEPTSSNDDSINYDAFNPLSD